MKIKKIKLQALKEGTYDIEEIFVDADGKIQRVIPKVYNEVYKGLSLYQETCEIGKNPIFLRALGIYALVLPCIVTKVTDWINEDYSNFEEILFYPVTTTEDYMEEIYHKELGIALNKDELRPLYQKYKNLMEIEEYVLNEQLTQIRYPVRLYDDKIFKSRLAITIIMKRKIREWRKMLPRAYFMIEYCRHFTQ